MKVRCKFCGKALSSQRGLNRHLQRCRPVKRIKHLVKERGIPSTINLFQTCAANDEDSLVLNLHMESSLSDESNLCLDSIEEDERWSDHCKFKIENTLLRKEPFRTSRESIEIKILKFCEKINAPLYAYDELMTILSKCTITDDTFSHDFTRRSVLLKQMEKQYHMAESKPKTKHVKLENGQDITVMTCAFLPMLHSVLNNPRCVSDDNLTFSRMMIPIVDRLKQENVMNSILVNGTKIHGRKNVKNQGTVFWQYIYLLIRHILMFTEG